MAEALGCDSLRYLPVSAIARAIDLPSSDLCQACITGRYPTEQGQRLYDIAIDNIGKPDNGQARTYEQAILATASHVT
jgi:amidophosphoribosyltransferase